MIGSMLFGAARYIMPSDWTLLTFTPWQTPAEKELPESSRDLKCWGVRVLLVCKTGPWSRHRDWWRYRKGRPASVDTNKLLSEGVVPLVTGRILEEVHRHGDVKGRFCANPSCCGLSGDPTHSSRPSECIPSRVCTVASRILQQQMTGPM